MTSVSIFILKKSTFLKIIGIDKLMWNKKIQSPVMKFEDHQPVKYLGVKDVKCYWMKLSE